MTALEYDGWAIERRQSDGVFEYVAFANDEEEIGVGRWDIDAQDWADLPDALTALPPDLADRLQARARNVMRGLPPADV